MIEIFTSARTRILISLKDRPHTLSEIARKTGYSKTTVSYHLSKLHDLGLVERKERGKWVYYRLTDEGIKAVKLRVLASIASFASSVTGFAAFLYFRLSKMGAEKEVFRISKAPEVVPKVVPTKAPVIVGTTQKNVFAENLDLVFLMFFIISAIVFIYMRFRR